MFHTNTRCQSDFVCLQTQSPSTRTLPTETDWVVVSFMTVYETRTGRGVLVPPTDSVLRGLYSPHTLLPQEGWVRKSALTPFSLKNTIHLRKTVFYRNVVDLPCFTKRYSCSKRGVSIKAGDGGWGGTLRPLVQYKRGRDTLSETQRCRYQ